MSVILVYGRIYGACLTRAVRAIGRSPWTLLLPVALWIGILLAQSFLGGLGFLSGIVSALALSALFSSYLYFVGELATDARVTVGELGRSFGSYFWAVGQIVRQEACKDTDGVAVRFIRLSEGDRKIIADYIATAAGRATAVA